MEEFPVEQQNPSTQQQLPPSEGAEGAKAEANFGLSPEEEKLRNEVMERILIYKKKMRERGRELSTAEEEVIDNYARQAAEVELEDFRKRQKQSPANLLIEALEELSRKNPDRKTLFEEVRSKVKAQVEKWQNNFAVAQGSAAIQGEQKTPLQIIEELIKLGGEEEAKGVPVTKRRGIMPGIGIFWYSFTGTTEQERRKFVTPYILVLAQLGFLPQEAQSEEYASILAQSLLESLQNQPREDIVKVLISSMMPGVVAKIELVDRLVVLTFRLDSDAVKKCVFVSSSSIFCNRRFS